MVCVGGMLRSFSSHELLPSLEFFNPATGSEGTLPYRLPVHTHLTQPWPRWATERCQTRAEQDASVLGLSARPRMQVAERWGEAEGSRDNTEFSKCLVLSSFGPRFSEGPRFLGVLWYPEKALLKLVLILTAKDAPVNTVHSLSPRSQANNHMCWGSLEPDQRRERLGGGGWGGGGVGWCLV